MPWLTTPARTRRDRARVMDSRFSEIAHVPLRPRHPLQGAGLVLLVAQALQDIEALAVEGERVRRLLLPVPDVGQAVEQQGELPSIPAASQQRKRSLVILGGLRHVAQRTCRPWPGASAPGRADRRPSFAVPAPRRTRRARSGADRDGPERRRCWSGSPLPPPCPRRRGAAAARPVLQRLVDVAELQVDLADVAQRGGLPRHVAH